MPLPADQLAEIEAAHAQPPRAYHNFGHVQALLQHHRDVAAGPGWRQPREVALAMLYHDAVYEAGRGDNEARSAVMARAAIARWLPDVGVDAERVAALIRERVRISNKLRPRRCSTPTTVASPRSIAARCRACCSGSTAGSS